MSTQTDSRYRIRIAPDRMSATLAPAPGTPRTDEERDAILAALKEAGIAVSDDVNARVEAYLAAEEDPKAEEGFVVAAGREAVEGTDGEFVWSPELKHSTADWTDDAPVDFYNLSSIITVEAETPIGRVVAPVAGIPGVDVFGKPVPPQTQPAAVTVKETVRLGDDGATAIATVAGRVVYEHRELFIKEVVEIAGDVDFSTGNLNLTTDAIVRGTIRDLFEVKSSKQFTVGGAIEAATIEVAGDVTVRGGILNRYRGKVTTEGEIVAKFCDEAVLHAGGDIHIAKEAMNSRIHTEGRAVLHQGAVIGGRVYARKGVEAHTLGSEASVPTEIIVGMHLDELRRIENMTRENERRRLQIDKIRQKLAPLVAQLKRLTREQREKVTEMMFQADSMAMDLDQAEKDIAAMIENSAAAKPSVLVHGRICDAVNVTIDDRVVHFPREFKGPVRIERRKLEGYTALVAVNQLTGSITELPARKVELPKAKPKPEEPSLPPQ
ncbi:MAG: DUF342 domain-containing protein [Phycisphaerales bacterium]|nr:DUF342 domain-containing protein [Phycisphaerales bacterium]